MNRRTLIGAVALLLPACGTSTAGSSPVAHPARGQERPWWERTIVLPPSTVGTTTTTTLTEGDLPTSTSPSTLPPPPDACVAEFRLPNDVLFATDSDVLDDRGRDDVIALARERLSTALRVVVAGAADSRGSSAHNAELSARRAEAVKAVLVGPGGVRVDIVTTEAWSDQHPVADEHGPDPETARALNRRVTVLATVTCPTTTDPTRPHA